MNRITELLNLEDSDIIVSDIQTEGTRKILTLETVPAIHFCPQCGFRMHSRGVKKRSIAHPILQDGYISEAERPTGLEGTIHPVQLP